MLNLNVCAKKADFAALGSRKKFPYQKIPTVALAAKQCAVHRKCQCSACGAATTNQNPGIFILFGGNAANATNTEI